MGVVKRFLLVGGEGTKRLEDCKRHTDFLPDDFFFFVVSSSFTHILPFQLGLVQKQQASPASVSRHKFSSKWKRPLKPIFLSQVF